MSNKIPLIVVCGPTASGKTKLAVMLAKAFDTAVVSADSMQIYKGMDIGTAKPTENEMNGIPHYMIDIVYPDRRYSVSDYVSKAGQVISDIAQKGKIPILAGGTGLYIDTLVSGTRFGEIKYDEKIRGELSEFSGLELKEKLLKIDPAVADRLHENDKKRLIRALEIYFTTGVTMSEWERRSVNESPYEPLYIGLTCENRQLLYDRINIRVDTMIEQGLVDEVKNLLNKGIPLDTTAMQAIGYKEIAIALKTGGSITEAVEIVKMESRRYAKRQLTWFRRNDKIHWFFTDKENFEEIYSKSKIMVENSFLM
ncbi:MAG: tRNA (adenosine(37)-N6)-dimethylallyltransferase MiaA [Bacillota bacterium]|nr:tRNA (adenosine(37)-N6)-dimethylallyltransferase MiaA [Bacillota bacterium]